MTSPVKHIRAYVILLVLLSIYIALFALYLVAAFNSRRYRYTYDA